MFLRRVARQQGFANQNMQIFSPKRKFIGSDNLFNRRGWTIHLVWLKVCHCFPAIKRKSNAGERRSLQLSHCCNLSLFLRCSLGCACTSGSEAFGGVRERSIVERESRTLLRFFQLARSQDSCGVQGGDNVHLFPT